MSEQTGLDAAGGEAGRLTAESGRVTEAPSRQYSQHAIHLVRTSQQVNMALSQMADQKASILMGATFVVFTIAVGQASRGVLPVSLSVLGIFAFASALCAVLAVLPSTKGKDGATDDGHSNWLFFGVFTRVDEDEWIERILAELHSDETVFRTILRDIYQNGQVMQRRKYRFLGFAYRLFILGLVATLIVFLFEHIILR